MARTRVDELAELSMVPPLAKRVVELIGPNNQAAIAALTPVTTPDATDEATAVTLANANKAAINAIIAALQTNA